MISKCGSVGRQYRTGKQGADAARTTLCSLHLGEGKGGE